MSLFEQAEAKNFDRAKPLAARMRPRNLEEFVGQKHFLAEGKLLWRLIKSNRLTSVLFYGPPGCGKTTLAQLLASETKCRFRQLNAVTSGVKELREVLQEAQREVATGGRKTLLFVDEIHRFNKSQQDALLPDVENGIVILVGATTSNPFFAVNSALVSRSQIFQFEPLTPAEIHDVLRGALSDTYRGLGKFAVKLDDDAAQFLGEVCDGDARRALNALEIGVLSSDEQPIHFTRQLAEESIQKKAVQYDRDGDTHYDTASALIKSIRGSDVDAAIYWLAKMLEGGEDIRFITRRLIISASEDIGNADPHALTMAVSAMQACEMIGLPECQLTLSQTVAYLACAPKSNAATVAIGEARKDIREGRVEPVPVHLRDAHYGGAKELGNGEGYEYSHDSPDGIAAQTYLGIDREYYRPVPRGFEATLQKRVEVYRKRLRGEDV
ncbi:AAA family ATPase [Blastopirellula marina]|uniref:Replication-associated recombination protein A n=1 Tax=Blastopirellula marina TaxID=124 RepID=A0A2S8FXN9_9BACT|nr:MULTISPECIES: replication-associated recombination protein A [Pirellulaceae]PQO36923.1 AAA family ATPase [Blastopirellula marina]RCS53638.1 replication-associated recombination protein A [Bremerella cremea]